MNAEAGCALAESLSMERRASSPVGGRDARRSMVKTVEPND
jgi:hypothetical protein